MKFGRQVERARRIVSDAAATDANTTEMPRRQSLSSKQSFIDGIRRFRHALLPSKDASRSTPQPSPLSLRRVLEVEQDAVPSGPQGKRPSTSSDVYVLLFLSVSLCVSVCLCL